MKFPKTTATTHTLANGLTVILEPDRHAPVISTQVWVETGSVHEGEFLGAGISHLLEHMVFKGTESFSSEILSQTVQSAGGQWNAYTTFDRTVYYIDGPAAGAETFLKVLLEMVFKPTFPEQEFEKEKDVIRREIDMGLDDPDSRSSRQLFSTAFGSDARKYPVIGHLELFNRITREDMMRYHRTRYTTDNAFMCISGDFDLAEMLELLGELNSTIERSFTHPVEVATEPLQQGPRQDCSSFAVPAAKLSLAWQGPSLGHPDAAALDLAATILGSGRSSRLYQELREKRELCLHVGAWSYLPCHAPGMIAVSAELEPEQIPAMEQAVHEEIERLLSDSLDEELQKAKRMTLSNQFQTLTTASGRASDLASNWHETRNLDFTRDYLADIEAVSIGDIRRVIKTWLCSEQTLSRVVMYPEGYEKPEEKQAGSERDHAEIDELELANGLQVKVRQDPKVPLVAIHVAIRTGLLSESSASSGLNTLLASLLTKGTTSRDGDEIAATIESLGASLSASSGNNTTLLTASCLQPDLEQVLEIVVDCLSNPAFHGDAIEREKAIQINAIKESEMDPASLAFKELRKALFGDQGYGMSNAGTEGSVAGLGRVDLVAHHAAYFNASNMVVSIFGDVELTAVEALAQRHLMHVKKGKPAELPVQQIMAPSEVKKHLDKQQAVLAIGFPGVSLVDEDRYALALINAWCSDMAGPLFTTIREELGLAYYVSSTMFYGFDTGFFGFYMGTSPEQLELAREALMGAIEKIANQGMEQEVMERVKTSWLAQQALTNQSNRAMAGLCSVDSLLGLGADHFKETAEKMQQLGVEDIKRVAQRVLKKVDPTVVTVCPLR